MRRIDLNDAVFRIGLNSVGYYDGMKPQCISGGHCQKPRDQTHTHNRDSRVAHAAGSGCSFGESSSSVTTAPLPPVWHLIDCLPCVPPQPYAHASRSSLPLPFPHHASLHRRGGARAGVRVVGIDGATVGHPINSSIAQTASIQV